LLSEPDPDPDPDSDPELELESEVDPLLALVSVLDDDEESEVPFTAGLEDLRA